MTEIIAAMSDAFNLVGTVITNITSVPILLFFLIAAIFRLFRTIIMALITRDPRL